MNSGLHVDPATLGALARWLETRTGIHLQTKHADLVRARLAPLASAAGCKDLRDYLALTQADPGETRRAIDALTTNLTSFWREPEHFKVLYKHLRARAQTGVEELRLWSAAASTGEEVWCMAATALEATRDLPVGVRVLGTDLSSDALGRARRADYATIQARKLPPRLRSRHFEESGGRLRPTARMRHAVHFARLNLVEGNWPMSRPFDAIFCRNVLIYFSDSTVAEVVRRCTAHLRPGGLLCVGHSETIPSERLGLERLATAAFQRNEAGHELAQPPTQEAA